MPDVYIVDDDQEMSRAVRLLFKLLRYEAQTFSRARDLAHHLLAAPALPDLLVLDMNMPDVNGMDVVKWIRGSKRFKEIPMIVLSSETYPDLVNEALTAGANAYLFKPVTLEELEATLKKVFPENPKSQIPKPQSLTT